MIDYAYFSVLSGSLIVLNKSTINNNMDKETYRFEALI